MSTHAWLLPARTPRAAFSKLLQCEVKVAWRMPIGLILGVAAPVFVLVIMGAIPGMNKPEAKLGGLTFFGVYFPILIAISVAILGLISLPTHLATYRQQGILRRISTTPVPPSWMLAAQVIINLALAVVALGILVVAGTVWFHLGAPRQPAGFVLALLLLEIGLRPKVHQAPLCLQVPAPGRGAAGTSVTRRPANGPAEAS